MPQARTPAKVALTALVLVGEHAEEAVGPLGHLADPGLDRDRLLADHPSGLVQTDAAGIGTDQTAGGALPAGNAAGDLICYGRSGDDTMYGGIGDDRFYGGESDDRLRGRSDGDSLVGGLGDDFLDGQGDDAAADWLFGGSGQDTLVFNDNDTATGGSGGDTFGFNGDETGTLGGGGTLEALVMLEDFAGASMATGSNQGTLAFTSGLLSGSFTYLEAAAFTGGGNTQARFDEGRGQLEGDLDGDGTADIAAAMTSVSLAAQLTAGDFVFS